ncbi:MAG: VanZ family protein, partial [Clostridia bacterium]|nr:VanZ family protein [Clostridia bacterium]
SQKATTITTVIIAFLISSVIEAYQYIFSIGLTQTDDIICNTVGALIGTTVILVPKIVNNKILDNYNFK